ncbi:phosphatidylinositol mannoside acyltransferase [Flexivirga caeni]|uniref:Phosphatidylinositol mannoside acyltransferase n=1 Tax=Flexivirga caeni TaxID=2294115 RepID=A0A3M9MBE3_9MICO|nr:phosphatidylinositol mannoside acyltransferase [Flexivirga caeni]RNI22881.1 phosphatidylinositol mannoside acyltransferase [Flexivirga caeni]
MTLRDHAEGLAYRAAWRLVCRMPERAAYGLFDRVARTMHRRGGRSVEQMRANYSAVRPELSPQELDQLVGEGVSSYLRYWCDAFRLPRETPETLAERIRLTGHDAEAQAVLDRGEPLILFLGHLGNWDHCGAWATYHFAPVTTVAERLKPESVFDAFVEFRESLGMRILPLTGGDNVYPQLREAISRGGFVPLLADRDLTRTGVDVTLCGHPSRAAIGPARLALDTGAALFPLAISYEPIPGRAAHRVVARFGPRVLPPAEGSAQEQVRAMTQQCVDSLGETIRERTQDWHMMQRIFVAPRGDASRGPRLPGADASGAV